MKKDLIQESIYLVTEYYRGSLQPFFDAVSEDILWIGPRGGQILRGKDNLIRAWTAEETPLRFSMGNIAADSASTGRNNLEVILEYYVYTHFPSGEIDRHHQRLHYSWGFRREEQGGSPALVPEIHMIHISNITAGPPEKGKVYASSPSESRLDAAETKFSKVQFRTVYGKGANEITYYFNSITILWIESADEGRHSVIHTTDGTYRSIERLRHFEEKFSGVLLRVHASYLINPLYVQSVRRFEVTLTDGTILSIPEKKYTAFRKSLENWS